uniref:C2H2-type domain-containing protein n=1 Tax=Heterorhabditis bacteriophora TaxID=37862 RepID=A0A1I7XG24_HETBA
MENMWAPTLCLLNDFAVVLRAYQIEMVVKNVGMAYEVEIRMKSGVKYNMSTNISSSLTYRMLIDTLFSITYVYPSLHSDLMSRLNHRSILLPEKKLAYIVIHYTEQATSSRVIPLPFYVTVQECRQSKKRKRLTIASVLGDVEEHICKHCFKRFNRKYNMVRHEDTVHGGRSVFHCPLCNSVYKHPLHFAALFTMRNVIVQDHLRRHDGHNFACENCDAKFTSRNALKVHRRNNCVKIERILTTKTRGSRGYEKRLGNVGEANLSHLLSTDNIITVINFSPAYVLEASTVLEPIADCPMDCLTVLNAKYHAETDYYVSTRPGADVNSSHYSIQYMGTALCYIWSNLTTTTTTLSTSVALNSTILSTTGDMVSTSVTSATISSKLPPSTSVSSKLPPSTSVSSKLPPSTSVSSKLPSSSSVSSKLPSSTSVSSKLPSSTSVSSRKITVTTATSITTSKTEILETDVSHVITVTNEPLNSDHYTYSEGLAVWKWLLIIAGVIIVSGLIVVVVAWLTCSFIRVGRTLDIHPYESGYTPPLSHGGVNTSSTIMPPPLISTNPLIIGLKSI